MARGRARIEWQKEGGRRVGGMLKSRRDRSWESKKPKWLMRAEDRVYLSREIQSSLRFFFPLLFSPDFYTLKELAKFII